MEEYLDSRYKSLRTDPKTSSTITKDPCMDLLLLMDMVDGEPKPSEEASLFVIDKKGNITLAKSFYGPEKVKFDMVIIGHPLKGTRKETKYYLSGKVNYTSSYVEWKRQGVIVIYFENGNVLSECKYSDDKKNGVFKQYYEDGTLHLEAEFKDDLKCGYLKQYNSDGSIQLIL
jgi:hypothetical protein